MEKKAAVKRLFKYQWIGLILVVALAYGGHHIYKKYSTPSPLVYLIPEDYMGPVFVFFSQQDGVGLIPDPPGHAVKVPKNGLVKLRASVDEAIPSNKGETKQVLFWVAISKGGIRRNFVVSVGETGRNEKGEVVGYYADSNLRMQTFLVNDDLPPFHYFTEAQKNERMIFNEGGCRYQRFIPKQESDLKRLPCGKFLVMSSNELLKKSNWIWDHLDGEYTSIQELEKDLNEVIEKKKTFYPSPGK